MALVPIVKVTNTKYSIFSGQVCQNSRFGIGPLDSVNAFEVKPVVCIYAPLPLTAVC